MLKKKILTYLFIITILSPNNSFSEIKEKILVNVDNEIITSYDLKNQIKTIIILSNKEINQNNIDKTKKVALNNLVNLMIKKIEVNKFDIQIKDNSVSNYLNTVSNGDIDNLKKIFLINNFNFESYRNNIEIELRWQKLIVSKFRNKIIIDDQEIQNLINQASNEKKSLNEYKLSKIEIIFNDKNDLKYEIENIKNEINKYGFEDTALRLKVSNSQINKGEIDWINEKALSKTILDAIKNLEKNEISKPIIISNSVLFLKVKDIKKSNLDKLNLKELKKNIVDQKTNELLSSYSKSHLSKLRNVSLINYR